MHEGFGRMIDITREPLRKWGAAAHRGLASARQGRTTNAMLKHRGGVLTPYGAATPLCPSGYSGTGPSATLGLLDVAHGYALTSLRSAVSRLVSQNLPAKRPLGSAARGHLLRWESLP